MYYDKIAKFQEQTNMVVRTTLASREDSFVDALLEVLVALAVFPEEDQTCSWATEGLVTKSTQSVSLDGKSSVGTLT